MDRKENKMTELAKIEPVETTPAPITPMEMLNRAVEQGADLDKLTKLMDLQDRWEANEARKAFVVALGMFKADPPNILKNKEINHGNRSIAKYAGLDQVSGEIGKALSKVGLSHRWDTEQLDGGLIRVTCILTHERGHTEKTTLQAGADTSGAKNSVQAIGSTVTYLQRYTLLAATGMATADMDDDGAKAESISPEQKTELVELMKETGADTSKFLAYMRVASLDELPASKFEDAKKALAAKRKAAK